MDLENIVNQLTHLLEELTPAIDSLVSSQKNTDQSISKLVNSQAKANLAIGELRQSNMALASAIDRLVVKIDKVDDFEPRLTKLESKSNQ